MARPLKLRMIDERQVVPLREEDREAPPPVQEAAVPAEAEAIIAQLRAERDLAQREKHEAVAAAEQRAVEAEQKTKSAGETIEALRQEAVARINAVEKERDAAKAAATEIQSEKKKTAALATAVSLGLAKQVLAECTKLASWIPALGSLLGGFWLFDRTVSAPPSPQTLIELALYGAVVVAPAVFVTVKGKADA